jgi:hypothetical protein
MEPSFGQEPTIAAPTSLRNVFCGPHGRGRMGLLNIFRRDPTRTWFVRP